MESIINRGNLTQELKMGKNLSRVQQAELQGILKKFPNVLAASPGKTTMIRHSTSIRQRQVPCAYQDKVMKELNEMDRAGIIRESDSPWVAPMVVVIKKGWKFENLH